MRIPDKVKILYKNYTVVRAHNVHNEHNDLYGQIDYGRQVIELDGQYPDEQQKATLIHEVVHGLDDMYRIGLGEKVVERLGVALYQFIKDNPEVFQGDQEEKING